VSSGKRVKARSLVHSIAVAADKIGDYVYGLGIQAKVPMRRLRLARA
jgi:hypothetical protein